MVSFAVGYAMGDKERTSSPMADIHGTRLVTEGKEPLTYTVFDLRGHEIAAGHLQTQSVLDLTSTGRGMRLCEITTRKGGAFRYKVICP